MFVPLSFQRMLGPWSSSSMPSGSTWESDAGGFSLSVQLPGYQRREVGVEVHDGALFITARRRTALAAASFFERVPLPPDAAPDSVTADLEDGVLTVRAGRRATGGRRVFAISAPSPAEGAIERAWDAVRSFFRAMWRRAVP